MSDTIIAALIAALIGGAVLIIAALIASRATIQAARITAKGPTSRVGAVGEKKARKSS
jgi:hypothetical protein